MTLTEQQARQNLEKLLERFRPLISEEARAELLETEVIRLFIEPLLKDVLGWPLDDIKHFRREYSGQAGRPDMILIPERGGTIFVEAKRFDVIKELKQAARIVTPTQMALPGMPTDRTKEEQQAINYAFANNGTWAILTDFQKLRLFNARRDWLVLSFETPYAYRDDFDLLWQLSYENILMGSLEALSNQRHREEVDTEYLQFINTWREKLAQDIVEHPQDNGWAFSEQQLNLRLLRKVVQRYLDRMVIVRFAEDHLVIPPGTLQGMVELRRINPYTFSMVEFLQKFFRRFDEAHNSALFSEDETDTAVFSDSVLLPLVDKLYEARYRSMLADILGNTYEQYLGKTLVQRNGQVETADNLETRKKQGSYYTPQVIVRYIVDNSLGRYLYGTDNGKPEGNQTSPRKTSREIENLKVLDSACGSGSFLIYAYYVLQEFYLLEQQRIDQEKLARTRDLIAQGVTDPMALEIQTAIYTVEKERIENYPRIILEKHLYGVDLDPQAAEIAVVNLMMRALEGRHQEKRLPLILNQNVKVGNSLIGHRPGPIPQIAEIRRLRQALINTPHGEEHHRIIEQLAALTAEAKTALNTQFAPHFTDLERIQPFHWGLEFPEVFYDEQGNLLENGGFDIIFGNPPWEVIQPDLREYYAQFDSDIESRLNAAQVDRRIQQLNEEDPSRAATLEGINISIKQIASYFKDASAYEHQGSGKSNTYGLFVERMYSHLLKVGGRWGYVVPSGIYTDLGTKALREMLLNEGHIQYIFSFSNERFFFPGVDHRFKFAMIGAQKGVQADSFWATFRFNPRVAVAPDDLPTFLANEANLVHVKEASLERFSPNSLSLMEFQTQKDYMIAEKIYGNWPLIIDEPQGAWQVKLNQEINMTSNRYLLNTASRGMPLYEGKMIHQYDAFFAKPQYWIDDEKYKQLSKDKQQQTLTYRVVHRRIAGPTNERTLISAIVPPKSACEVNATVVLVENTEGEAVKLFLCGLLNSFVLDYIIRHKISTTLNMFYMYQLPMPRLTAGNAYFDAIVSRAARLVCVREEFAGLWESVMGTTPHQSIGEGERQQLRNEIDGLVARLYGLTSNEFDHILSTFPLVFPADEAGRRKREQLLEVFEGLSLPTG